LYRNSDVFENFLRILPNDFAKSASFVFCPKFAFGPFVSRLERFTLENLSLNLKCKFFPCILKIKFRKGGLIGVISRKCNPSGGCHLGEMQTLRVCPQWWMELSTVVDGTVHRGG
jgi:hypothetical protein